MEWGGSNGPTTPPPTDPFNLVLTGIGGITGATGTFNVCSDPTCSGSVAQPLHFDANSNLFDNNNMQIYPGFGGMSVGFLGFKTTLPVGTTFTIQPQAVNAGTWTGWNLQGASFHVVSNSLTLSTLGSASAGTCNQITLSSGSSLANETYNFYLTGSNGLPQARLYLDSSCSQELATTGAYPWETVYSYTTDSCSGGCTNGGTNANSNNSQMWLWIMDPVAEGTSLSVTTSDDTFAPGTNNYNFTPVVSSVSPTAGGTGTTLTLTGAGFAPPLAVRVGNQDCPLQSVSPSQVICTVPSGSGSNLQIALYQRGTSYPAPGYYFSYTGFDFFYPSPTIYAAIGYPMPNSPAIPPTNTGQSIVAASCSVTIGSLPSGFTVNPNDCSITGSSTLDPSQPLPFVTNLGITATGPASATFTGGEVIEIGNFPIVSYWTGAVGTSMGMGTLAFDGSMYTLYIQSGATVNSLVTANNYGAPISTCSFGGALSASGLSIDSSNCSISGPILALPVPSRLTGPL
jgi:hypothetical protein